MYARLRAFEQTALGVEAVDHYELGPELGVTFGIRGTEGENLKSGEWVDVSARLLGGSK